MRNIFSFLTSALVLLAVTVACHPSEITNPDNPDPKGKSEITITASIIQTRVSYDCSGLGEVKQHWEKNDILFGFWGGSTSNRIVFQVVKVDSGTGIATLKVLSPEDWINKAADKTVVDLVYTGDVDVDNLPFSGSGIDVDLSGQSLDRVPGCMHAHAELQVKDNKKSLEFKFQNDCALIEIEGLTGVMEEWNDYLPATQTSTGISYISIPNLYLNGSYSFKSGELSFVTTNTISSYEITLDPNDWFVDNQGFINGPTDSQGNPQRILIAVAPFLDELPFTVNSTIEDFGEVPDRTIDYDYKTLEQGHCYVITSQPVVAKTADGQYFRSVKAAFANAEDLYDNGIYTTVETNYVKLLRPYINGLDEDVAHEVGDHPATIINIDYPVTLDLNGCTLTLDCYEEDEDDDNYLCAYDSFYSGGFSIESSGELTIKDEEDCGFIDSCSKCPIITNSGTVNIVSGSLNYLGDSDEIIIPAVLTNAEADKDEDAFFNMSGGYIYGENGAIVLDGNVRADISGGLIKSNIGNTVEVKNGGGGFKTAEGTKVPNCTISGGTIGRLEPSNRSTGVSLNITDGSSCKISGGIIYNLCTNGNETGAISCYTNTNDDGTSLTVEWPKDSSENPITNSGEPLIYSCGSEADVVPINANVIGTATNYALIYLNGGYLYHKCSNTTKLSFLSCDNTNGFYNIASFGEVYSNTNACRYSGSRLLIPARLSSFTLNDESTRPLSVQSSLSINISDSFLGEGHETSTIKFSYRIY